MLRGHTKRAVAWAAVGLLACAALTASAIGATMADYTEAQQENTLKFLQAFKTTIPALRADWLGSDFCNWEGVKCMPRYATVTITVEPEEGQSAGSLPDVPSDVDPNEVIATRIVITDSGLTGSLPETWGSLSKMVAISLYNNSLSGTLPASWGSLSALFQLTLYNNSLTGSLPVEWSEMTSMRNILLQSNSLSGTLPSEWSKIKQLGLLYLQDNELSGTLPAAWSTLLKLTTLYLQNNQFTESVPADWGAMPRIRFVNITGNALCGCLPAEWAVNGVEASADAAQAEETCATTNAC